MEYEPAVEDKPVVPDPVFKALDDFASSARRLESPDTSYEETTAALRQELAKWATDWKGELKGKDDLHSDEGVEYLTTLFEEVEVQERFANR